MTLNVIKPLKNTATKAIALTLATSFAVSTALPVSMAEAHPRQYSHSHTGHGVVKHHTHRKHAKKHRKHKKKKHRHNGDAIAAGILGFAIGAIIADQASRNHQPEVVYVQPQPRYVEPQPIYTEPYVERRPLRDTYTKTPVPSYDEGPTVIRYEDEIQASYEPWTKGWAEWCDNRYRSFNINTGTFRGYDGRDHFCVVK